MDVNNNITHHLLSTNSEPGNEQGTLSIVSHLVCRTAMQCRCPYPHFRDGETERQRS